MGWDGRQSTDSCKWRGGVRIRGKGGREGGKDSRDERRSGKGGVPTAGWGRVVGVRKGAVLFI